MAEELTVVDNLIPAAPEHSPEPPQESADALVQAVKPEISFGRKRGEKKRPYTTAANDPLDRFIARRRAQSILALKLEGRKAREIAAELNIPAKAVYWALYQLRRGGHLEAAMEVGDSLTHSIKPLIVERLQERLEDEHVDQELLIAAAKGTGIFIDHSKVRSESQVQQALVVRFEMPAGETPSAIGEIHGAPLPETAIVDAEVVTSA